MCKLNPQRLYEEYTILWFKFDMCGFQHQQDATYPTLDHNTGSEKKFQRQEQVRDDSTVLEQVTYSNMHSSAIGTIFGRRFIGSLFM